MNKAVNAAKPLTMAEAVLGVTGSDHAVESSPHAATQANVTAAHNMATPSGRPAEP